jgi:KUP system potassium uptake protein
MSRSYQGIKVANPSLSGPTIVGASCVILVFLFSIQPLGIHRISCVFAPIMLLWLFFNASYGIYNLTTYDHSVLAAFSPHYAAQWFVRNKSDGFQKLGGILLAFSGVECLFADMGAFTRLAVQLSWLCLVFPCLLLSYAGQAAYLLDDPAAHCNPFFRTVPPVCEFDQRSR